MPKGVHEQHYERLSRKGVRKNIETLYPKRCKQEKHGVPKRLQKTHGILLPEREYRKNMQYFYREARTGKHGIILSRGEHRKHLESFFPEGSSKQNWKGGGQEKHRIIWSRVQYHYIPKGVHNTIFIILFRSEYRQHMAPFYIIESTGKHHISQSIT